MGSTKPNPYLSEEARLQAQRRMLAERYGLSMSDDDENDVSSPPPQTSSAVKTADRTPSKSPASKRTISPEDSNGRVRASSSSSTGSRSAQSGDSSADAAPTTAQEEPDAGTAPRAAERVADSASENAGHADKKDTAKIALAQPWLIPDNTVSSLWPGVVLADPDNPQLIPRVYTYDVSEHRDTVAKRSLRVTPVTVYASQFMETDGRKIAVNDRVITYAVGGHIRAIVRKSSLLTLLKGHMSAVIDTEFLSSTEKRLGSGPWVGCSVLGSVSEDGYAYVWRLLRSDEENGFKVADAIPISHKNLTEGGKYSRISFRPGAGSVVADNGVGVAICLLDPASPNLRLVEMVKMEQEVMLRNKFLRGADELHSGGVAPLGDDEPVSACTWMDEHTVAVSRGENVHIWLFENGTCEGRLPRTAKSKVHSLHAVEDSVLLVAVDAGRSFEIWSVKGCLESAPTFLLNQTVHLCTRKPTGSTSKQDGFHGVIAIDPLKEIIVVANATGLSLFAMHYNKTAKAVDAMTEIPMKNPVFSISVTRSAKSPRQDISIGGAESASADELNLWCVQPKGIQMVHLNSKDCAPAVDAARQLSLSPSLYHTPKNASTNKTEPPPVRKAPEAIKLLEPEGSPRKPSSGCKLPIPEDVPQRPPLQPQPKRILSKSGPSAKKLDASDAKNDPNTAATRTEAAKGKEGEEIAEAVLEATKRVIDAFEKAAEQRDAAENARVKKLIPKFIAERESQMTAYVNRAMKKPMVDSIAPKISKIVMNTRKSVENTEAQRGKVSEKLFAHAFEKSNLGEMFKSGCEEIFDQTAAAVSKSMAAKCTRLVNPSVKHIVSNSANLTKIVNEFVKRVESVTETGLGTTELQEKPVDVREEATALMRAKKMNDAFLIVLNEENLELVNWLCGHFDPKTFFESNTLSQVAVLSLAQQLGQGLGVGDTVNTIVEWLRELMLVLEPTDEDIVDMVNETLAELRSKVSVVQKQPEFVRRHAGLAKQLKTLNLVLTSLTQ